MKDHRLIDQGATSSDEGRYRYLLWREFEGYEGGANGQMTFIMLNPSTADATSDDPTIRRCITFALRHGCLRLEVVNLFAFRATSPRDLRAARYPIGADNDDQIVWSVKSAEVVVCAWGTHGKYLERGAFVRRLLSPHVDLMCFGVTANGQPKHPLYLRADTPLVTWGAS